MAATRRRENAHFGTIDVLGGYMAAAAAGAALVMRMDQGQVSRARASLAAAGQLIQAPFMYDHKGRTPFNEPSGRNALGEWAGYRFYLARDNWIFLACAGQEELNILMTTLGLAVSQSDSENQTLIEQVIRERPSAEWVGLLTALDFGVVAPASIADLRDRYLEIGDVAPRTDAGTYQFVRHAINGAGRWVDLFAPCAIRPAHGRIQAHAPAEKYGESTRKVLRGLKFDEVEIISIIERGAASDQWCEVYLPE